MGDQKFPRKKYSTPRHPWEKERIDQEREVLTKYGLKNKRELWKSESMLASFRVQARNLQAKLRYQDPNAEKQLRNLVQRLNRYNILGLNATLDDILALKIENILERRLQTMVYRKNLARTQKQARQLITHGHIVVGDRRITLPGLLVEASMESSISYDPGSPISDELHPVRQQPQKQVESEVAADSTSADSKEEAE